MPKPKRPLSPTWNFALRHPDLARQWDYEANAPLRPEQVTPGSGKDVWWICPTNPDHRWEASPYERSAGHGCAICTGKVAGRDNSVAAIAPHLVNEWHPNKNGLHTPWNTTYGSRREVWWQCERGHVWPATPNNRTARASGCPHCKPGTSRIEIRVASELMTLFPDEADWRRKAAGRECDVLLLSFGMAVEVDGWVWHRDRVDKDNAKTAVLTEANIRLLRLRDDRLPVLTETDVAFRPNEPDVEVMRRLALALAKMLDGPAADTLRAYAEGGALVGDDLFASMTEALPGPPPGRSLVDLAPEVAAEWDHEANGSLAPTDFFPFSGYPAHWNCGVCGHKWRVSIGSRTAGNGCPGCSGRAATRERNLAVVYPDLVAEWDWEKNGDLRPETLTPKSSEVVFWRCVNGHSWLASVNNRANGSRCKTCVEEARESLLSAHPDIAAQWHPTLNGDLAPSDVSRGSKIRIHWMCPTIPAHIWTASINSRTAPSSRHGCPFCSGKRVSPETSLAVRMPDLAAQWDLEANAPRRPEDVTLGSHAMVAWRCQRGHTWSATVASRVRGVREGRNGCPTCRDPLADAPFDSLPRSRGEAVKQGAAYYYTGLPCTHGHVAPRMTRNKNCRECNRQRSRDYHGLKLR